MEAPPASAVNDFLTGDNLDAALSGDESQARKVFDTYENINICCFKNHVYRNFFFHPQMLGTLQKYAGFIDSASVLNRTQTNSFNNLILFILKKFL